MAAASVAAASGKLAAPANHVLSVITVPATNVPQITIVVPSANLVVMCARLNDTIHNSNIHENKVIDRHKPKS